MLICTIPPAKLPGRSGVAVLLIAGLPLVLVYGLAWIFMPAWGELPEDFERRVGLVESLN